MMEGSPKPQPDAKSPKNEQLSREKLLEKCQSYLAIAQKAKIARDEALQERSKLLKESEEAKSLLDTLQKEKASFLEQLQTLAFEKENYESETESLRRRYDRLLNENDDLSSELQIRERSESQLLNDIKKLHENNESVKILCTNVTQEKILLEEELSKLSSQVEELTAERNLWNRTLCPKLGVSNVELKDLVALVDKMALSTSAEASDSKDTQIEELSQMLLASQKNNEALQQEISALKDKTQWLMSEIETANVDKDHMMANLEGVQVETKTLIENVEKLTEEIDVIKAEKLKSESALNKVIESKNEEIDSFLQEISKHKAYITELLETQKSGKVDDTLQKEELLQVVKENEQLKKTLAESSHTKGKASDVERNVLFILKEGIVSNLTDLADTMPEYSKEFLNKLDAILEGANCEGEDGAKIFVHYFNECLSQLKISLKENEILTKEVDHLKNSIKELENSVANHNKDCELLREELEELSSDSNRLLMDLSNLRHENSIRMTEIGELMVRLKQRDDQVDQLKESNYLLEAKLSSSIDELTTQLADANNNTVQLQEQNKVLETQAAEFKTLLADIQSGSAKEVVSIQEELITTKESLESLNRELENSISVKDEQIEQLQKRLHEIEALEKKCSMLSETNESLQNQQVESGRQVSDLTASLKKIEKLLAETSNEKEEALRNCDLKNTELERLKKNLKELEDLLVTQSAKLSNVQDGLSQNEHLMKELENAQAALNKTRSAKEDAEKRLQALLEVGSELELMKTKLEEKSIELNTYRKQNEELAPIARELEIIKTFHQTFIGELQAIQNNEDNLEKEAEQVKIDGQEYILTLQENAKKIIKHFGEAFRQHSLELEKAQRVLQEKEFVENELNQLKGIQQKTMEELETTKTRLSDEIKSLKKDLEAKSKEIEAMREVADEKEVAKLEFSRLSEELMQKSEELNNAHDALEKNSKLADEVSEIKFKLEAALKEKDDIKEMVQETECLRSKVVELEENLAAKESAITSALKELEESKALCSEKVAESEDLLKEINQLKETNSSILDREEKATSELKDQVERLQTEISNNVEEKSKLAEQVCTLKKSLESASKGLEDAKILNHELQSVLCKVAELESILVDKESALVAVGKKLAENEIVLSEIMSERDSLIIRVRELEKSEEDADLKGQLEKLQKALNDFEKLTEVEAIEKQKALQDLQQCSEEVQCLRCENKVLNDKLVEQGKMAAEELKKKNEQIQKLLKELEDSTEMVNFKVMEVGDINCVWAGRLNSLKVNLSSLGRSLHDMERQSREVQHMFVERLRTLQKVIVVNTESVVEISVAEAKKELLDEMHRMNEVLKDRGEAIANLQDTLGDTEGKLEALKTQNAELSAERSQMQSELKSKEEKIVNHESQLKELESEVARLKELKEPTHDSDVLSTSTISRAEDHMRLKEVDDSIEEKYVKLKQFALKLRKRVAELTADLEQEKSKAEKIQHLSSVAKNAQKVQESHDRTLDELDDAKKKISSMTIAMKELNDASETMKKQLVSLESQNANIPLMHKQLESLNNTIKELKNEMNRLEMEKRVEVMKYEESKKQCTSLEAKIENLSLSLDQAVQQGRSNNVLELEMKNYEKVVADLTAHLNSEKQKLANSEKELSAVKLVKSGLDEQITLLEKQINTEESRNASLQDQITSMREKVNASQHQFEEANAQLSDLKRELQHLRNLNEQQALEMSSLTSDFSRKEIDLQGKIDSFTSHIQSLETNLATVKQELLTSNSEKEHVREEFESYRLRAQSMLARQKGDSVSQGEKEAREQFDKLKKELDLAREKMENNQTEIETLNNKLSSLQLEKARSDKRYEDITKALHQKITDYDTLNTEYRAFKFSAETMLQNTKIEFEEKERGLKEEVTSLNELINSLNERIMEMQGLGMEIKNNDSHSAAYADFQHLHEVPPSLQEREDGEGSESVPPPLSNYRRLSNLVPLDILLNNPIDDENRIPVLQEKIEKLHLERTSYEVRVKHLTSLLSEAEKDAARSSQQNSVLKEELRRLERSLQREPHIANSEYLKNVIFKFLVLQSGDERQRLVPVLDTILKLSPDETSRLAAVARGETASWGSYLHSWTGL